jgi:hypothetical protein
MVDATRSVLLRVSRETGDELRFGHDGAPRGAGREAGGGADDGDGEQQGGGERAVPAHACRIVERPWK